MNVISKLGWIAAAALGLFVVATFGGIVSAGPLDPTSAPAPTQRTQNDLLPAWHQTLSATGGCNSERFDCVLTGDVAVLDRETGLVWQRSPTGSTANWEGFAVPACLTTTTGGRKGWRLPTVEELQALLDPSVLGGVPQLPPGSPFSVANGYYWTANTYATSTTSAYVVQVETGQLAAAVKLGGSSRQLWCVRGSQGYDGY